MNAARASMFVLVLLAPACNAVWGVEPGILGERCSGNLCLTLELSKNRPAYDDASGAKALGLDGSGVLWVSIFVTDPTLGPDPPFSKTRVPDSGELRIEDFPRMLSLDLAPSNYWITARWEDKGKLAPGNPYLRDVGDFVASNPTKVSLAVGATSQTRITLEAGRRIDLDVVADPRLAVVYKDFQVNGDGVWYAEIFDEGGAGLFEGASGPCINLAPLFPTPPTVNLQIVTGFPVGTHHIFFYVDDYDLLSTATGTTLPSSTLATDFNAAAPTFTLVAGSWTTKASIKVNKLIEPPMPLGAKDPRRCK